jgi:hypothetical protein
MAFANLSAREKVARVETFMVELRDPDARLSDPTRAAVRRAELVIADDDLPADEHVAERERWCAFVDALPEVEANDAEDELRLFVQLYDGLLRSE